MIIGYNNGRPQIAEAARCAVSKVSRLLCSPCFPFAYEANDQYRPQRQMEQPYHAVEDAPIFH